MMKMESVSIELVLSFIAMIIGVSSYLHAKDKDNNDSGRERATVEVKLDFILKSLEEIKSDLLQQKKANERTNEKIVEIEKENLKNSLRLDRIEKKLEISEESED